jgi:hypothetical protein
MNGYLMQEQDWVAGQDLFIESFSPENHFGVVFEDDGEAAYFYAIEKDEQGEGMRILDALHIYESAARDERKDAGDPPLGPKKDLPAKAADLKIVWTRDWLKCALVIDGYVHALFDFQAQSGYNINEFPPPNSIWTKGDRKLTDELIRQLF